MSTFDTLAVPVPVEVPYGPKFSVILYLLILFSVGFSRHALSGKPAVDPDLQSNNRPISDLNSISKILEKLSYSFSSTPPTVSRLTSALIGQPYGKGKGINEKYLLVAMFGLKGQLTTILTCSLCVLKY